MALRTSDIIFPAQATNFSSTLASLKRSTLSITNRLRSIDQDSQFVCTVADAYGLPLIANERCGSWYIPPERKVESAYFKSTDGHTGQWAFSLRRLNTQVLDVAGRFDGCVIVDSTRRGKRMPDALSKTVPIWCAVLNRLLFHDNPEAHALHTPPQAVSSSEHSQIESRLGHFVKQLRDLNLDLAALQKKLRKPLRPLWVTPESSLPDTAPSFPDFHPVLLCTASRRVPGGEMSESGYIQGAGDDSEGWAHGLTAQLYWQYKDELMCTPEEDLPELIESLVKNEGAKKTGRTPMLIKPTKTLFVGTYDASGMPDIGGNFDGVVHCGETMRTDIPSKLKNRYLHLQCVQGKLGSRDLRKELPKIKDYFAKHAPFQNLLVCCSSGNDISVGVALAFLCLYADDNGEMTTNPRPMVDKTFIRQRLSWILTSNPTANPSRATLQSVNTFLMSEPAPSQSPPLDQVSPHPSPTRRLFDSLQGRWSLSRTLASKLITMPSGTFTGTGTFQPRLPQDGSFGGEYLYEEEGTFKTEMGLEMAARRKYVWRYSEPDDKISVWFVGADEKAADGLFHEVVFATHGESTASGLGAGNAPPMSRLSARGLTASGRHWCDPDTYVVGYEFDVADEGLRTFGITHEVKGPKKDYMSWTQYER